MRMIRALPIACLVVVAYVALGSAQQPAVPVAAEATVAPALTEIQKLQIQNLAQRIEIAQLRAQQAQQEFERAREEITKLVQSLEIPGWDLDLQKLEYVKKPEPPKERKP